MPEQSVPVEYTSNPFLAAAKGLAKALQINPIPSLLFSLVLILIFIGITILSVLLNFISSALGIVTLIATMLSIVLLLAKAVAASTIIHLKSFNGEAVTTREAIGSATNHRFFAIIGLIILTGLATIVGLIFLIIPGIIIASRLALSPFALYNENLGVIASMKRSWQLTKGHTIEMLGASVAQLLITGNGLLGITSGQAAYATRYVELTAAERNHQQTGKPHWLNLWSFIILALFAIGYFGFIGYASYQGAKNATSNDGFSNILCYDAGDGRKCVSQEECQRIAECSDLHFAEDTDQNLLDANEDTVTDPQLQ